MKRGDIRWYTFKAPDKRCPVMILIRSDIISYPGEVTMRYLQSNNSGKAEV